MKSETIEKKELAGPDEDVKGYRFGGFELDLERRELRRRGLQVRLAAKPLELLVLLVRNAGRVVSRDEIRRVLWGDDAHVEADLGINTYVRQVRGALEDIATAPRFVETVPRRGYRFVAPVEPVGEEIPSAVPPRQRHPWIAVSVAVVLLLALGTFGSLRLSEHRRPRLVVVPFQAVQEDADAQRLAVGLREEVVAELTRRGGDRFLIVPGKSVVGAYRGVSGHVRRDGDRFRVTVRLTDGVSGEALWVGTYDRRVGDRFGLETELSRRIGRAVGVLAPAEWTAEAQVEARRQLELGRWFFEAADASEGFRAEALFAMAQSRFERAVELSPDSVDGWLGLVRAVLWTRPSRDSFPIVRNAVDAALALDDHSVEAHLMRFQVAFNVDWDLEGARRVLDRLDDLAPDAPDVLEAWTAYWIALGQFDEAEAAIRKALALSPEDEVAQFNLGLVFYYGGRPEAAFRQCSPLPRNLADECMLVSAMAMEDWDAAGRIVTRRLGEAPRGRTPREWVDEYWRRERERFLAKRPQPADKLARASMALGAENDALGWLETAFERGTFTWLPYLHIHPLFRPLHGHPRFEAILAQRDRLNTRPESQDPAAG